METEASWQSGALSSALPVSTRYSAIPTAPELLVLRDLQGRTQVPCLHRLVAFLGRLRRCESRLGARREG